MGYNTAHKAIIDELRFETCKNLSNFEMMEPDMTDATATRLDGKALAKEIENDLSQRVATLVEKTGRKKKTHQQHR